MGSLLNDKPHNVDGGSYAEGQRLQGEAQAETAPKTSLEKASDYSTMLSKYLTQKGLSHLVALGAPQLSESEVRFLAYAGQVTGDGDILAVWSKLLHDIEMNLLVAAFDKAVKVQEDLVLHIKELIPVVVEGKTNGE